MIHTAVSTLNSSDERYRRSVASNFMFYVPVGRMEGGRVVVYRYKAVTIEKRKFNDNEI